MEKTAICFAFFFLWVSLLLFSRTFLCFLINKKIMIEPIIKQRGIAIKNGMTLLINATFIVIFNTGIIKNKEKIKVKGSSLSNFFGNK